MSSVLDHKLRKIIEHNNRMKEQLELPRIPVSQASESLISYTQNTKDYLLPSIWGPPSQDPFANQPSGNTMQQQPLVNPVAGALFDRPSPHPQLQQLQSQSQTLLQSLPQTPGTTSLALGVPKRTRTRTARAMRRMLGCILYPCLTCLRPQLSTSTHPPSDFILFHPILRRYVKHATLIERCFPPEKSGETTPNSNELSYLVYYAQSKPAKLTKVGAYLSKRIARDTQKLKRTEVLISLRIYDALLDSCGRDLHFFARDVLGSLDTVLAASDFELSKAATHTFALFCRCHTGATLAIDRELRQLYTRLVKRFASQAHIKTDDQSASSKRKAALGLCAIQAIAESQATYAAESYYELPRIVKAITSRITSTTAAQESAAAVAIEHQIASIATATESASPNDQQLVSWAWRCLETLVQRSHGQHSRIIISEIFRYLDSHLKWQPTKLCVDVVTTVISRLQTQDQNMVIVETLAFLTDGTLSSHLYLEAGPRRENSMLSSVDRDQPVADDASSSAKALSRRACIIRILESMFCQPYVLVGISVMEALNVLVSFLLETVAGDAPVAPDYSVFVSALPTATEQSSASDAGLDRISGPLVDYYHLLSAIGGLATHHYYSSQLIDMVGYLVSQMGLADDKDVPVGRRQWLLQALYMVMCSTSSTGTTETGSANEQVQPASASLPLDTFAPLFTLLTHDCWELRAQAADCIVAILRYNSSDALDPSWTRDSSPALVDAIYQKLALYLSNCHQVQPLALRSASYAALAAILREMLGLQGDDGAQSAIWVVDQNIPSQENPSWVSLLAMVWERVASIVSNTSFERHVSVASRDARDSDCWDATIEDVCMKGVRIMAIDTDSDELNARLAVSPLSNTADAGTQIRARDVVRKLGVKAALECLGHDALAAYAGVKAERSKLKRDATSLLLVDRILCGSGFEDSVADSDTGSGGGGGADNAVFSPTSAIEHINEIRARVSIDWEAQMQHRESSSMPQINLDHLRAALRDGLAMRSSDHVDGIDRNPRARGGMGVRSISRGQTSDARKPSNTYSTSVSSVGLQAPPKARTISDSSDEDSDTRQQPHSSDDEIIASSVNKSKQDPPMDIDGFELDMTDANGQPISDEIRDLLASIDDGETPLPRIATGYSAAKHNGLFGQIDDTSCSSAVSTPVVNHVN
ncbi:plasma membrane localization protein [Coemansia erecta]|uniref:Guanine nucleotide-binding protein subunit gamma n=1 Tax=Coemansia erecta TaxID=147472 RepID=A0A9W7XZL6_9FUNG|nr:plasma membrane localization protein [Coemansia erecta]